MVISSFSYNQEYFVFYIVGQCNAAQLQAAHPPCHVFRLHGVEHITELIFLFGRILVGSGSDVFVQLLVVIVFYLLADGGEQALFFAYLVLSATFRIHFLHFGHSVQFAIVNFLLESAVAYGSGYGSYDGKGNQANNQYPHTFSFLEKKVSLYNRTDKDTHCFRICPLLNRQKESVPECFSAVMQSGCPQRCVGRC